MKRTIIVETDVRKLYLVETSDEDVFVGSAVLWSARDTFTGRSREAMIFTPGAVILEGVEDALDLYVSAKPEKQAHEYSRLMEEFELLAATRYLLASDVMVNTVRTATPVTKLTKPERRGLLRVATDDLLKFSNEWKAAQQSELAEALFGPSMQEALLLQRKLTERAEMIRRWAENQS